jgi:hypothetical protein
LCYKNVSAFSPAKADLLFDDDVYIENFSKSIKLALLRLEIPLGRNAILYKYQIAGDKITITDMIIS